MVDERNLLDYIKHNFKNKKEEDTYNITDKDIQEKIDPKDPKSNKDKEEKKQKIRIYACKICNFETDNWYAMEDHLKNKHYETAKQVSYTIILRELKQKHL